ncbi:uncharacterized protein LOC117786686 [Drosophila innubila]|uniref:uncharacterized protein LOC117786686 n=1 Tax=Drosophila innubila TaxID=198719 RepID=UPI00148CAD2F|nr:uncharacterized protein LOC117786686 [Drosophila innubila]
MWSIQLFYAFLKLLRVVFYGLGFLRLQFDGSKERYEPKLLLLFVCCLKHFYFDWPLNDFYNICDYLMSAVRLLFVLLLSLQFFYHLLHASVLQSLNLLLQQQKNLKLWHQLLRLQPLLLKLQHFVACYFGVSFCGYFALLCLRCGMYLSVFSYDELRFMPQQSNQSEMDPLEMPMPPTRGDLLRSESLYLAWQVALMWLLLCVALVHQRERNKLLIGIWQLHFPTQLAASGLSESSLVTKDILSFLLTTRVSIVNLIPGSLNFIAWKLKCEVSGIKLVGFARSFKLLLQMVLGCTIVYYMQQGDLLQQQQCLEADCVHI